MGDAERKAIRAMGQVVRDKEAGRITADEALRRLAELVAEYDARRARDNKSRTGE